MKLSRTLKSSDHQRISNNELKDAVKLRKNCPILKNFKYNGLQFQTDLSKSIYKSIKFIYIVQKVQKSLLKHLSDAQLYRTS